MAVIIDSIGKNDLSTIYKTSFIMLLLALSGLIAGYMGGVWGAKASTGFARNLRKAMYENIQTFSFQTLTNLAQRDLLRLTTDVTNVQNAYQMILRMCVRAPFSLLVANDYGILSFTKSCKCIFNSYLLFFGIVLVIITLNAHKYFTQVFKKYDKLNETGNVCNASS